MLVNKCCGCGACVQACSKNCISLQEDDEGFLYPVVNTEKCTNCNRCSMVCPITHIKNEKLQEKKQLKAYAVYASDDEIRKQSSSGGVFSLVANMILDEGGIVFGAAFDEENMVHHIAVNRKEDLYKLRGSKYLQSRIENTYSMTKKFLNAGKRVLFTGTACQISGLKGYLGKEYERLITMDILCHGVPSPKVWKKYLQCHENKMGAKVSSINFRNKEFGWKNYSMKISFTNDKVYKRKFTEDEYMKLFLKNFCLRPSCYECKFKELDRDSDITIGDCWGIEKIFPEMDDDRGISVVIIHNKKGQEILDSIKAEIKMCEAEVNTILPPSADSRKSVTKPDKREKIFENINKGKDINFLMKLIEPSLVEKIGRKIKRYIRCFFRKVKIIHV